jgi:hypothetical protein
LRQEKTKHKTIKTTLLSQGFRLESNMVQSKEVLLAELSLRDRRKIAQPLFFTAAVASARIYRPSFRENKPNTLVFND